MREKVGLLCSLRVMLSSGAGPFLDGFSTASAAFLISLIEGITPLETAFFTSLYLAGSFIGAAIFGSIADHVGRRPPFLVAMAVVCALTVLAATFPIIGLLLFMRLALGICLGGDYPVGQAMVFETVPAKRRNTALSILMLAWYLGALTGIFASIPAVTGHMHWVSILYLQSALAAVTLALRYGVAESEIWLKSTRPQTQHAAIRQTLFTRPRFRSYLSDMRLAVSGNAKNFFFCASFWLCQTIPATIMMLYSPTILHDMTGSDDAILQMLLLYGFFLAGVLPSGSPYLANRPKLVLATTFVTMALGLLGVLFFAKTSLLLTNISFILFAVSYGLQAPLDFIYPNQLFATQVRGSLVGAVTAISRIGATGAAFTFPVLEPYFELSALFGAGLFVLALGFMISVKFAPADRVFHQNC